MYILFQLMPLGSDTNSSMGVADKRANDNVVRTCVGQFGLQHVNDSGRRFKSYIAINNMRILTTFFRKKSYATWIHPRSRKLHQIDHVITTSNEFCRFMDAGVTAPLIGSDHRAVYTKLRVMKTLKKSSTPRHRLLRLDYTPLRCEESLVTFNAKVLENYRGLSVELSAHD